jgi:iron complex outermembrane recepter protein
MYGAEAHVVGRLMNDLRLDIAGAYLHAKYTNFPAAQVDTFDPIAGFTQSSANVSGNVMERAPKFSGTLGINYDHELFTGKFNLSANYSYVSKVYFDANELANQPGYGLLNIRGAWTDASDRWTVSLSGRNVTNKIYLTQVLEAGAEFGQIYGAPASVYLEVALHL